MARALLPGCQQTENGSQFLSSYKGKGGRKCDRNGPGPQGPKYRPASQPRMENGELAAGRKGFYEALSRTDVRAYSHGLKSFLLSLEKAEAPC